MTIIKKGQRKEVAGNSKHNWFVPPAIHQSIPVQAPSGSSYTHTHEDMSHSAGNTPSTTSHIPSSRASNACASSNAPESPVSGGQPLSARTTNVAHQMFIRPRTKTKFDHQLLCVHQIGELIEMHFKGAWKSWKKFPNDTKDLIFSEFGKHFKWDPTDDRRIRSIFDSCAMNCIKNRMYQIRKLKKKPKWLGQEVFKGLNEIFAQDEFKKVSDRNIKNRASDCDGQGFPLHIGGCVSHSEHIDRLTAKQGHEPSIAEAFMHLRSTVDSDGNVKWVNDRAKKTHEEYTNKLSQLSSQNLNEEKNISTQDQIKIFTEVVGGPKKGIIYGLAGQPYQVMHGSSSSIASPWSLPKEWENERTQLLNRIDEIESSFEARVKATIENKVTSIEAMVKKFDIEAMVEARVKKFEMRLMERFGSFERNIRDLSVDPQLPDRPPSHQ